MKKFLPILILLIVGIAGTFFYLQNNPTKRTTNSISEIRPLVSTSGWKEYTTDIFTIKYPPNYITQNQNGVVTISEPPDEELLNKYDSYEPKTWSMVEIFSPVEYTCTDAFTCKPKDEAVMKQLNFFPTEWNELLLQLDGHSPIQSGTSRLELAGKQAVHRWFIDRAGLEGYPLSESNLYIKLDNTHILPMRGEARKNAEKNLAILETIYSTIVFH